MPTLVDWRGPQVRARVLAATKAAIDECTESAARDAAGNHWWRNRSGDLQGNIVSEPAKIENGRLVGRFGTSLRREGFYGLFLERKTPFLRPAADREFPALARRVRVRLSLLDRIRVGR